MAEGKKSFVLYADLMDTVNILTDEQAGKLFKHILEYVNDLEPVSEDVFINIAFTPIKQQLKRDLNRWEDIKKNRSKAGKASAEKRKQQKLANSTRVKSVQQRSTKSTVNDNVNVNVNVNDTIDFNILLEMINKIGKRDFKTINKDVKKKYLKLLSDGYTKEQIRSAIINAHKDEFHIESNFKHLTPEYFSRAKTIDLHCTNQAKDVKPITKSLYD